MPWVRTDAGVMHVKTSKKLHLCSCRRFATLKCDWPKEGGGTCDRDVCKHCARHVGPDTDYCPFHRGDPPMTEEQKKAAGEAEAKKAAAMFGLKR